MRLAVAVVIGMALIAPGAEAGRGTALVKYLPDDATMVVVADVAKSRRSPIFKKGWEAARRAHEGFDRMASAVALDKLVDTIVIGGTREHLVAVVEGRVDRLLAEVKKTSTKTETHGAVQYFVMPEGEVALLERRLVFATAGDMPAVIDRAANKKAKGPAAMRTILANATPASAVFGGAVLDVQARKDLAKELGAEPEWAAFSFGMASKLTVEGKLRLADDTAAQKVAQAINDKLGAPGSEGTVRGQAEGWIGKDFSDSITVDHDHSFARLAAALTGEEVDKVLTVVKMLM